MVLAQLLGLEPLTWRDLYDATDSQWKLQEQVRRDALLKKGLDPDSKNFKESAKRWLLEGHASRGRMYVHLYQLEEDGLLSFRDVYLPRSALQQLHRQYGYSRALVECPRIQIAPRDLSEYLPRIEVRRTGHSWSAYVFDTNPALVY
jgi:hypothetical protein